MVIRDTADDKRTVPPTMAEQRKKKKQYRRRIIFGKQRDGDGDGCGKTGGDGRARTGNIRLMRTDPDPEPWKTFESGRRGRRQPGPADGVHTVQKWYGRSPEGVAWEGVPWHLVTRSQRIWPMC